MTRDYHKNFIFSGKSSLVDKVGMDSRSQRNDGLLFLTIRKSINGFPLARERREDRQAAIANQTWIPACAGMTVFKGKINFATV